MLGIEFNEAKSFLLQVRSYFFFSPQLLYVGIPLHNGCVKTRGFAIEWECGEGKPNGFFFLVAHTA